MVFPFGIIGGHSEMGAHCFYHEQPPIYWLTLERDLVLPRGYLCYEKIDSFGTLGFREEAFSPNFYYCPVGPFTSALLL
jgi:hypothetical protein